MSTAELVEKARIAQHVGATVKIVGAWVWAEFESKPSVEARQALKDAGYHWNSTRGCWQYAGVPCRHTKAITAYVWAKYGAKDLTEVMA